MLRDICVLDRSSEDNLSGTIGDEHTMNQELEFPVPAAGNMARPPCMDRDICVLDWSSEDNLSGTIGDELVMDQELELPVPAGGNMTLPPFMDEDLYAVDPLSEKISTKRIEEVMLHKGAFAEKKCFQAFRELEMQAIRPNPGLYSFCYVGQFNRGKSGVSFNGAVSNPLHPICNSKGYAVSICQGEIGSKSPRKRMRNHQVDTGRKIWKCLLWKSPDAADLFEEDHWEFKKVGRKNRIYNAYLNKSRALYLELEINQIPTLVIPENSYSENEGIPIKIVKKPVEEEWERWDSVALDGQKLSKTISHIQKK